MTRRKHGHFQHFEILCPNKLFTLYLFCTKKSQVHRVEKLAKLFSCKKYKFNIRFKLKQVRSFYSHALILFVLYVGLTRFYPVIIKKKLSHNILVKKYKVQHLRIQFSLNVYLLLSYISTRT